MACRGSFVPGRRQDIESPWLRCLGYKVGSVGVRFDPRPGSADAGIGPVDVTYARSAICETVQRSFRTTRQNGMTW